MAAAGGSRELDCCHAQEDGAAGEMCPLPPPSADGGTGVRDREQGMGFRQFLLRDIKKGQGEWGLVILANIYKRPHTQARA